MLYFQKLECYKKLEWFEKLKPAGDGAYFKLKESERSQRKAKQFGERAMFGSQRTVNGKSTFFDFVRLEIRLFHLFLSRHNEGYFQNKFRREYFN